MVPWKVSTQSFVGLIKIVLEMPGCLSKLVFQALLVLHVSVLKHNPFWLLVPQQSNSQIMIVEPQPRIHCLQDVQLCRGVINQFGARLPPSYFYLTAGSRVLSGQPCFLF